MERTPATNGPTAEGEAFRAEEIGTQPRPPSPPDSDIPGGIPVTVRTRESEASAGNDDDCDGSQSSYSEFDSEEEEEGEEEREEREEEEQYSEFEDDDKVVRHSIILQLTLQERHLGNRGWLMVKTGHAV